MILNQRFEGVRKACERQDLHLPHVLEILPDGREVFCPGIGQGVIFQVVQDPGCSIEFEVEVSDAEESPVRGAVCASVDLGSGECRPHGSPDPVDVGMVWVHGGDATLPGGDSGRAADTHASPDSDSGSDSYDRAHCGIS